MRWEWSVTTADCIETYTKRDNMILVRPEGDILRFDSGSEL